MSTSIQRRLLVASLLSVMLTWVVTVAWTASYAQMTVIELVDRQLSDYMGVVSRTLLRVFNAPESEKYFWKHMESLATGQEDSLESKGFTDPEGDLIVNLWIEGVHFVSPAGAPQLQEPHTEGFSTQTIIVDGQPVIWRVLYHYNEPKNSWVAVALDLHKTIGRDFLTLKPLIPLITVLPFTLLLLWWAIRYGLKPLAVLREKLESRSGTALEPVPFENTPKEVELVISALNQLLARLREALESERRFTSNAAHELQTPLASIKAEVQFHQRYCKNSDTSQMLEKIHSHVERATTSVSQLLTLARLDNNQKFEAKLIRLDQLVLDVMAEAGQLALNRELTVDVEDIHSTVVDGQYEWVKILVRNIITNAFKYCKYGGLVKISCVHQVNKVVLSVSNDCDEIPKAELKRLTERFFRLSGSGGDGVGLGLSIAEKIAALHQCHLQIAPMTDKGGFKIELIFRSSCSSASN